MKKRSWAKPKGRAYRAAQFERLLGEGKTPREIAGIMCCDPVAVYRRIKRRKEGKT